MAYTENQLKSAPGQMAGGSLSAGMSRAQTDLERARVAISQAMELCEELMELEIKLIGYPDEVQGKDETSPPMPEAALPRLGMGASELMSSVLRARAALIRINGAL